MNLFDINTCSLPKNIEELECLINKTKIDFDIIGISESRIKKNNCPINSINLKSYSYESCSTESSAGGTLLYINNHLSYKTRSNLCIYKSGKLESIFIEIWKQMWLSVVFLSSSYGLKWIQWLIHQ